MPIFYDPMISKLVAWAEDRPLAVARMRRALGEYSSPASRRRCRSSRGCFAQPEFIEARFHTTYLDEVLKARNGRPFVEPTPDVEEVAAIAAALQAVLSPRNGARAAPRPPPAAGAGGSPVEDGAGARRRGCAEVAT